jgi:hypothetical protein
VFEEPVKAGLRVEAEKERMSMSASQDKNQKFTFVYSNIYKMGKKTGEKQGEKTAELDEEVSSPFLAAGKGCSGVVLKARDMHAGEIETKPAVKPTVSPYVPSELKGRKVPMPEALLAVRAASSRSMTPRNETIESLKQNLKNLNELHARLRFMLQELEELVKE